SALVTAFQLTFVPELVTVTFAPAIAAPCASVTVPMIRPVAVCAVVELQAKRKPNAATKMQCHKVDALLLALMTGPPCSLSKDSGKSPATRKLVRSEGIQIIFRAHLRKPRSRAWIQR